MRKFLATVLGVALALTATVALAGRNSSGTMSFTSVAGGYPFQSGQTISSSGVNSNFSELATELSDSLSRSGKGGMSAPLRCADGTAAAPAFSWTSDTNTGLYRLGADDLGISVGGTLEAEISTTLIRIPSNGLSLTGSGDQAIDKDGGRLIISTTGAYDMVLQRGNTPYVSLNSGSIDMLSHRVSSVATPTDAADAATKAYVDSTVVTTTATFGTNWGAAPGQPYRVVKHAGMVTLTFTALASGAASWSAVLTVPAGYRPGDGMYYAGRCLDASAADYPCILYTGTDGVTGVVVYDNGTSNASPPAGAVGDTIYGSVTFVAEN